MQIIREESYTNLHQADVAGGSLGASLFAQYESIGADLKSLVQEWEDGKSSMTSTTTMSPGKQSSIGGGHSSSSSTTMKSPPLSPSFSLSGRTAVENDSSMVDALTSLSSGDSESSPRTNKIVDDEEIFEADALPRHRKRASLTRDERIARVREERARKLAAQDRVDTSTNMLKELEMVIKQRPRARTSSARVSSP